MKQTKQFLLTVVALTAFTACSDSNLESGFEMTPSQFGNQPMNTAVLKDANGQQISNVSANQATYYLNIKTDGLWYIETPNNMEFTPTKMYGRGSACVPVLIGNNWAQARQLSYKVKFMDENGQPLEAATRGTGDNSSTLSQDALVSLERFKKVVNSNVFVGYGYDATKNPVPELCTGIQIFKMEAFNNDTSIIKHDFVPDTKEVYYHASCDSMLDKQVAVDGNPGGNFGAVKLGLDFNVSVNRVSQTGHTVVQKSLRRIMYSREIEWAKNKFWMDRNNYDEGYLYYKDLFISQFKRSCIPDSPKVGSVSLSPRGDWRMPSDASFAAFIK